MVIEQAPTFFRNKDGSVSKKRRIFTVLSTITSLASLAFVSEYVSDHFDLQSINILPTIEGFVALIISAVSSACVAASFAYGAYSNLKVDRAAYEKSQARKKEEEYRSFIDDSFYSKGNMITEIENQYGKQIEELEQKHSKQVKELENENQDLKKSNKVLEDIMSAQLSNLQSYSQSGSQMSNPGFDYNSDVSIRNFMINNTKNNFLVLEKQNSDDIVSSSVYDVSTEEPLLSSPSHTTFR
ncbi:hypothetical protein [Wolbachia endosymbiont of Pentidionis agamae]|uniref:hypothetical protein n=1 Tax=Wolbachia endosymbiont of Pentidionis agamae TaxID=3110435 RepID=UPI002FD6CA93